MKITTFSVTQLHGFLDIETGFNDDLTVIVGRNGAGKTSALNLISDLLRLDVAALRRVPFKSAVLELEDGKIGKIRLSASNVDEDRLITLQIGESLATLPLDLSSEIYTQGGTTIQTHIVFQEILKFKYPSTPSVPLKYLESAEWFKISRQFLELTKLTFVRLDRTIVTVDPDGVERTEIPKTRSGKSIPADPIDEVVRVTTQKYGEYKRRVEEIKSTAFDQLLQLHFEPIAQAPSRSRSTESQLKEKVKKLRQRVEKSALFADSPTVQAYTSSFFESFSKLLFDAPASGANKPKIGRRSLQEESAQILLNLKERQIEKLLEIFEGEQEQAQAAYRPIKRYIEATMKFLHESGKSLEFDASLQLGFNVSTISSANPNQGTRPRNLKELASGERQVLIVLTYLAFLAGENSIFIIDEPELSLHLRWQSYLVDALKQLRPDGCQIIIATHAPEIAGRAKSKIKILKPSYLPSDAE